MERRKLDLPDRRQHTYSELEKKLNEHVRAIERRLHRFFMKALFIFAVIGITSAVALFGFAVVLQEVKETRQQFVQDSCLAQNDRHDDTLIKFHEAAADAIERYPDRADEIRQSVKTNLEIIDALAPKQDCERLGKVSIGAAKPPPPSPKKEQP